MNVSRTLITSLALLFAGFVCERVASAASITVQNYSFEDPALLPGQARTSTVTISQALDSAIPGWGAYVPNNNGSVGVERNGNATEGVQAAYLIDKAGEIYQDVGAISPNTTYQLTVSVVAPPSLATCPSSCDGVIKLRNGTDYTGTELAFNSFLVPTPQDVTLTYTTGASVSGDLTIALGDRGGGQQYDNVRLTASPVPLPTSAWLLLSGLGALSIVGRGRKA